MKKTNKYLITLILCVFSIIIMSTSVFAIDVSDLEKVEYTDEYKEYIELSDEEKSQILEPRMYEIFKNYTEERNLLRKANSLGVANEKKFSLRDIIPQNTVVRNQMNTNSCWAFASIAALESNLALTKDSSKVYDFSERHMEYATTRNFLNNKVNEMGFNRNVGDGGVFRLARTYLTNGSGAISEAQMPFENNQDMIDISGIQNKTVNTHVYDTIDFPSYEVSEDTTEIKQKMKEYIKQYGAIAAGIYGAQANTDYCNNETGAIYCNNKVLCKANHAVAIIGWDDDFSVEKFNEKCRPQKNGAWIVKNSWGEKAEYTLEEMKAAIFEALETYCQQNGWNEASQIPDKEALEIFEDNGYKIENNKAIMIRGDNGIYYLSYEDVNIYSMLFGIIKSSDELDYENIYQYDELGYNSALQLSSNKAFLGNIFDKKTNGKEYLTQVAIYIPEAYKCKVYVNPNGSSLSKSDLQSAVLQAGETESVDAGFHTIEFAKPIKINSDKFAVVVELQSTRNLTQIPMERNYEDSEYDVVKTESGRCFVADEADFEKNEWIDLSKVTNISSNLFNGDSTIKAYTTSKIDEVTVESIKVTTPPTKTVYTEGENFDKTGMIVTASYSDGSSKTISDYSITNGTSLKKGQESVTISYEETSTTQKITVNAKASDEKDNKDQTEGKTESKPENTDLSSAQAKVTTVKSYTYTDKSKSSYIVADVTVSNINRDKNNDSYEYYYYLSGNQAEKNIQNWVKISETQNAKDKLTFTMNSKDMTNYKELLTAEKVYLYIKEVAIKGGNQTAASSNAMSIDTNVSYENYVDDKKVSTTNSSGTNNNSNQNQQTTTDTSKAATSPNLSGSDGTTATKILPKTGMKNIVIAILVVCGIGIFLYIKFRKIEKNLR